MHNTRDDDNLARLVLLVCWVGWRFQVFGVSELSEWPSLHCYSEFWSVRSCRMFGVFWWSEFGEVSEFRVSEPFVLKCSSSRDSFSDEEL
jgi:hypothetical protein